MLRRLRNPSQALLWCLLDLGWEKSVATFRYVEVVRK